MSDKLQEAIDYFTECVEMAEQLAGPMGGEPGGTEHYRTVLAELTRLQSADDLDNRRPEELYDLKEALSKILVFGAWVELTEVSCVRPEPARKLHDSRVCVWYCGGEYDLEAGWYCRIDGGVVGIPGVSGTVAYGRAQDCMAAVDKVLAGESDLYLVGTAEEKELA